MVDSREVVIVDKSVLACQGGFAGRNPAMPTLSLPYFSRSKRSIWKPPEQANADENADEPIEKEHPLKPD
jgi:hypothetical protein